MSSVDRTPEFSPSPLDGEDPLALALNGIYAKLQPELTQTSDELAQATAIVTTVRTRYENEVLYGRESIWNHTKELVGRESPTDVGMTPSKYGGKTIDAKLVWGFLDFDTKRGMNIWTKITYNMNLGLPRNDASTETSLRQALAYSKMGARAFNNGKVPDELLGIGAEGRRSNKGFPRDKLLARAAEYILEGAHTMNVSVTAEVPGRDTKPVFDFEVSDRTWKNRFDMIDEPYLEPGKEKAILRDVYADLRNAYHGGQEFGAENIENPTIQDFERYLYNQYLKDGIGDEFRKLQSVNALVQRSNPVKF
jgi:hypothetical protein